MVDKRKPMAGANGLLPPARLSAAEQRLWDAHIKNAPALRPEDTMAAFTWVRLSAAYAANPNGTSMNAIKHMNQIGGKLGFNPSQRRTLLGIRRALEPAQPVQPKKKHYMYNYFSDPGWVDPKTAKWKTWLPRDDPDWEPPNKKTNGKA